MTPWFNRSQVHVTPDGTRYVGAAEGYKVSRPFHYRWLLPKVCGPGPKRWIWSADACALILPFLGYWYAGGGWKGVFVGLLAVGLAGIIRFNRRFPVLVDLPAMTVALAAAASWRSHWYAVAVLLAMLAACIRETSPVFIAAWAWTPWPLVALVAPAVRHFMRRAEIAVDEANEWHLREVIVGAFKYRQGWNTWAYILPWGACLVGLANFSPQLAVVLALAYGQLIIATDAVRLYQWAYPVLAVAAAGSVDPRWYAPLIAIHLVNPFASEGN